MLQLSLVRQGNPLAQPAAQRELLEGDFAAGLPRFPEKLAEHTRVPLRATALDVLQVNVGKVCNQTCAHCHVDAGPDRRESMSAEVAEAVLDLLARSEIGLLDITGGAPEMNPHFRRLVTEARRLGRRVIDRCNLTILLAPGYTDLPEFLAEHRVEVVASLPCYLEENCDAQRGAGVFEKSLAALRRLNTLGYGRPQGLPLTLVYNPVGPSLPPPQPRLEAEYRRQLRTRFGIEFTQLHTITNMPISRFLDDLLQAGRYEEYLRKLVEAFNPAAVSGLMCRSMISVDWRGRLYDCDFNQMLELGLAPELPETIFGLDPAALSRRPIATGRHCFGCTAGAGSGCGGAIVAGE